MLIDMFTKKYIGGRHIPERLFIKSYIKCANNSERKSFYDDYELIVRKGYILRMKKRTGKGFDWHISLNPHNLEELREEMK